jgi:hypothetical protein
LKVFVYENAKGESLVSKKYVEFKAPLYFTTRRGFTIWFWFWHLLEFPILRKVKTIQLLMQIIDIIISSSLSVIDRR